MNTYAGVGSRSAPTDVLGLAEAAARRLSSLGWVLRSGHAPGMDQAFERGAGFGAEVFRPWPDALLGTNAFSGYMSDRPSARAMEIAEAFHPKWQHLKRPSRLLHARNSHIVLGPDCDDPVRFVLCWTPCGKVIGGTSQALRIAVAYRIPVVNMGHDEYWEAVEQFVAGADSLPGVDLVV